MRIGVNALNLRSKGTALVGRNVLGGLAGLGAAHELEAWIPHAWGWRPDELGDAVRLHFHGANQAAKLIAENGSIRSAIRRGRIDRLFSLNDAAVPGCRVPHLLLIHTPYIAYRWRERDFPMSTKFRARMIAKDAYFRLCRRTVDRFTVQTDAMRRHLAERWSIPDDRISVVPSAIEPIELPAGDRAAGSDGPTYICYLTSRLPHKNHACLPAMMAELARRGHASVRCRITLTPEDDPRLVREARRLGVLAAFDFTGPLPIEAAYRLLANAAAHVFASKLETFGLPYAEAMALGCPTVAADREGAREMCGEAALYFDADDGAAAAAQVARILDTRDVAQHLADTGRARFAGMQKGWPEIAAEYLALLEAL